MFQGRPLYHTKVLKFPKPTPPTPIPKTELTHTETRSAHSLRLAGYIDVKKIFFIFFEKPLTISKPGCIMYTEIEREVNKNEKIHR